MNVLTADNWLLSLGVFLPMAGVVLMLFVPKANERLVKQLGIANVEAAIKSAEAGNQLRLNTEAALAIGVRNAPCVRIGSELFWGSDTAERVDEWLARGHGAQSPDLQLRVGWY